jgi:thiol-disulfide isomerase/thioredoxin
MEIEPGTVRAPEFSESWLNSSPLTMRELRGQVVLVDFWDYTCVNCIRTLPYLAEWHRRYASKGLRIIGVHTPEFSFARTGDFVKAAMVRFGIEYPVVLDSNYRIWQSFANNCWPAKYLIDHKGYIRYAHFGEGNYQQTETAIQTLLREANPAVELCPPMPPIRDTDRPGVACYRTTPELYLGYERGRIGNPGGFQNRGEGSAARYELPDQLEADVFYLSGPWRCGPESLRAEPAQDSDPASLLVFYKAKEVNLVMAPNGPRVHTVELLQDSQALAREDAGEDVRYDSAGRSLLTVDTPRMFNLVRNRAFAQHLLQLVAREAGLECFAFTFVSCAASEES